MTKQFGGFNQFYPNYWGHQHWGGYPSYSSYPSYPWNWWGQQPQVPKLPKGYSIWFPNPWGIPILVPTKLLATLPTVPGSETGTTNAAGASETETPAAPEVTEARKHNDKRNRKFVRVPYGYYGFQ